MKRHTLFPTSFQASNGIIRAPLTTAPFPSIVNPPANRTPTTSSDSKYGTPPPPPPNDN